MISQGQFEQLPMFMTAKELGKTHMGDLIFHEGGSRSLLNKKYKQSEASGLASDIQKNGIQQPVSIFHDDNGNKTLIDGHHRLSVAKKMGPNTLIPVQHLDKNDEW
jgi:ParB-like nuclease domain